MYSVSDEFLEAIRFTSRRKTVVDIYFGTNLHPIARNVPVAAGTVNIDRTSDIKRSGSITVSDTNLNLDAFLPVGIEIRIRSGFNLYSGRTETVPLGVFRVEDLSYDEGSHNTVNINFFDRGKAHQDLVVLREESIAGMTGSEVIDKYTSETFDATGMVPSILIDDSFDLERKFPGGTMGTGNNLDILKKVAEQWGGEQYFDTDGNHVFGAIPSVSTATLLTDAVWDIDVGESGVLISAGKNVSRSDTINGIVVFGATIDNTTSDRVYAQAYDDYPLSPTHFHGKFGKRTMTIQNDLLTTSEACHVVADQQLKNHQGLAKKINFTSLWNPALDAGDLVLFTFLDESQEIHLIDSLSFNLASGEMTGSTRTVQYIGN